MNRIDNGYNHKVDRKQIPTCNILGVEIAAINMKWLLKYTEENIEKLSSDYMCVSNVHTTVMSYDDKEYCKVQNSGVMAIPDGGPLSSLGRKRGYPEMERTTGPSYMEEILKVSKEKGYTHYFYGSTQETLDKMEEVIKAKFPDIEIKGLYSPPFRKLDKDEDDAIVEKINELAPDFIWVGLGAPKQEQWMYEHQGKVKGFMVGVGAGFDYLAGNISRAPRWMQKANLEWLYRLIQNPKRLFKRYFYTNTKFIWKAVILKK